MDHCLLFYFSVLYPMVPSDVYNGDMRIWLDLTRWSGRFWPGEWNELEAKCIFHLHSSVSLVPHTDMAHFWHYFIILQFNALSNGAIRLAKVMKTRFRLFFDFLTRWIEWIKCEKRNACPRSSTRLFFSLFFILLPWRPLSVLFYHHTTMVDVHPSVMDAKIWQEYEQCQYRVWPDSIRCQWMILCYIQHWVWLDHEC